MILRRIGASFAFVLGLASIACSSRNDFPYSGTVQAESAAVGSTIGGRVVAVHVSIGQRVRAGQALVTLDASAQVAALAQARAQLAQAQAALASLAGGSAQAQTQQAAAQTAQAAAGYQKTTAASANQIAAAQQGVRQAQADARKAQAASIQANADAARALQLYSQGYVSAQQRDAAISTRRQARAALVASLAQLSAAQANLDATLHGTAGADVAAAASAYQAAKANQQSVDVNAPSQIEQARANVDAARANVAAAQTRVNEMTIRAPADGDVEDFNLHAGDLVLPSVPVATIHELGDPFVRIYVSQADLSRLKVGNAVRVRSDAVANHEFDGHVEQIDTTAQFTPSNVQTAEDRANLNFGVKVRIHDPNRELRAGTTAEVALP